MYNFRGKKHFLRVFSLLIVFLFSFNIIIPPSYAQMFTHSLMSLPVPGTMVQLSAGYNPLILRGMSLHPDNPLRFDFILDVGDSGLEGQQMQEETERLIKYFMASLTVPKEELWVNLSPYEGDRIIPESFGVTEMGRDLLAEDYILKQLTASLMYPEKEMGRKFWDSVYSRVQKVYGKTDIPINTFNKVWIIPENAKVYIHENNVFVVNSHLKVMLEQDYVALRNNLNSSKYGMENLLQQDAEDLSGTAAQAVKEIVLPSIEKEVNEGEQFAALRQIYNAMILAVWYKQNLKESLLGKVYVDQNKIKGVDIEDQDAKIKIYEQYLEAFQQGVYNYIKEDIDPVTQEIIPRKYFSGGAVGPQRVAEETDLSLLSESESAALNPTARGSLRRATTDLTEMGPQADLRLAVKRRTDSSQLAEIFQDSKTSNEQVAAIRDALAQEVASIGLANLRSHGKFSIYSGPPGGGKGAVWDAYHERFGDRTDRFVLFHTREIRDGEVQDETYHYRSEEHLRQLEAEGKIVINFVNEQMQGMAIQGFDDVYVDPVTQEEKIVHVMGLEEIISGQKVGVLEGGLAWFEFLSQYYTKTYGAEALSIFISPLTEKEVEDAMTKPLVYLASEQTAVRIHSREIKEAEERRQEIEQAINDGNYEIKKDGSIVFETTDGTKVRFYVPTGQADFEKRAAEAAEQMKRRHEYDAVLENPWDPENADEQIAKVTEEFARQIFSGILQGIDPQRYTDAVLNGLNADQMFEILGEYNLSEHRIHGKFALYSGPPGSGKGAVWAKFTERFGSKSDKFILYHTRNIRPGEVQNKNYMFRTREQLMALEAKGNIVTTEVNGQLQGLAVKSFPEDYDDPVTGEHVAGFQVEGLDSVFNGNVIKVVEGGLGWFDVLRGKYGDDLRAIFISPMNEDFIKSIEPESPESVEVLAKYEVARRIHFREIQEAKRVREKAEEKIRRGEPLTDKDFYVSTKQSSYEQRAAEGATQVLRRGEYNVVIYNPWDPARYKDINARAANEFAAYVLNHILESARTSGEKTKDLYVQRIEQMRQEGKIPSVKESDLKYEMTSTEEDVYFQKIAEVVEERGATEVTSDILFEAAQRATAQTGRSEVKARVGLQPGTMNPITFGHISAGLAGMISEELNAVVVANGGTVPDKPFAADADTRNAMARAAASEADLSDKLLVTSIRNQSVHVFKDNRGEALAGENEKAQRFNMDMAAFIWLFAANPNVEWTYLVGSDKVAGYGKKGERGLLQTLSNPEIKVNVVYFERTGQEVNYQKDVAGYDFVDRLWKKGFFKRAAVNSYASISATKVRTALVNGEDTIDGAPITESITPNVFEFLRAEDRAFLRRLFHFEMQEKKADQFKSDGDYDAALEVLTGVLREVKQDAGAPSEQKVFPEELSGRLLSFIQGEIDDLELLKLQRGDSGDFESLGDEQEETDASLLVADPVGGIDLNPDFLDLQIERDDTGVPLPTYQQPFDNMIIEGFIPVIINIQTVVDLPILLGSNNTDGEGNQAQQQAAYLYYDDVVRYWKNEVECAV